MVGWVIIRVGKWLTSRISESHAMLVTTSYINQPRLNLLFKQCLVC